MRVHNPGPGEIADRLSILALKIKHCNTPARKQFEEEQKELSELWLKGGYGHIALPLILELCLLNAVMWDGEDAIRQAEVVEDVANLALAQQKRNDFRSELVKAINAKAGIVREEKVNAAKA